MNELITIQITPEDADLFKLFRKHQDTFSDLVNAGVFGIKSGSAVIDFNPEGELMDIKFNIIAFRRKK